MSDAIEKLRNRFMKWMGAFESKGLKGNLGKTKVMVYGGITKDGMLKSRVDPFRVCSLKVKANSVLCLPCGMCIHCRCAGVNRLTPMFSRDFSCRKCYGNTGESV